MKSLYGYILSVLCLMFARQADAQILFFHNAPDTLLKTIRIKVGDSPSFPLNFRNTAFFNFGGNAETTVSILNGSDSLLLQAPASLQGGEFYHCYINGLGSTSGYADNPSGADRSLRIDLVKLSDLPTPGSGETRVIFVHGATDLPDVDVTKFPGQQLVDDLSLGEYVAVNVPSESNIFNFRTADSSLLLISYRMPLDGRAGQTVVVMLSGFIAPPVNNNGPAFQGYIIVPGGDFTALANVTPVRNQQVVTDALIFPNPAKDRLQLRFRALQDGTLTAELYSSTGQMMESRAMQTVGGQILSTEWNIRNYPAGTYLIRLADGENQSIFPFIAGK